MSQRERLEPPAVSPLERQLLVNAPSQANRPTIQAVPPSSVLSKVKNFLPQLQQANEQLAQQLQSGDPSALDIEHIPEGTDAPVIQMDLACGLLDLKDDAALAAAQRAMAAGGDVAVETFDGAEDSDGSSSEDTSDGESSSSEAGSSSMTEADEDEAMLGEDLDAAVVRDGQAAPAGTIASSSGNPTEQPQQQQQQQQQQGHSRRRVKARRPMIVELS